MKMIMCLVEEASVDIGAMFGDYMAEACFEKNADGGMKEGMF